VPGLSLFFFRFLFSLSLCLSSCLSLCGVWIDAGFRFVSLFMRDLYAEFRLMRGFNRCGVLIDTGFRSMRGSDECGVPIDAGFRFAGEHGWGQDEEEQPACRGFDGSKSFSFCCCFCCCC
jgi:hypothetical protein